MSLSSNCGCGGCGCSQCDPANTIYASTCPDPGTLTTLRHLLGLDQQLCERRLIPAEGGGFLIARQTPNGWAIGFSTTPTVALEEFLALQGVAFGQVLVQQSDSVMRAMNGPAVANLVLGTNAAGQAMWIPIPAATVPDPLTVNDLTVNNLATLNNVNVTGTPVFSGLGTGALVSFLGLDASNNVIQGTPATTGVQVAMFYEQPVSPGNLNGPNTDAISGNDLTIGNLLFESVLPVVPGGALLTAINSQTLTVLTGGTYVMHWGGFVSYGGGNRGFPIISLMINGVPVSNGYANSNAQGLTVNTGVSLSGNFPRRLVVGDTIRLQLGSGSGSGTHVESVGITFERTGP